MDGGSLYQPTLLKSSYRRRRRRPAFGPASAPQRWLPRGHATSGRPPGGRHSALRSAPMAPPRRNMLFSEKTESSSYPEALVSELLKSAGATACQRAEAAFFVLAIVPISWWSAIFSMGSGHGGTDTTKPFAAVVKITGTIGPGSETSYSGGAAHPEGVQAPRFEGRRPVHQQPGGTPVRSSLIHASSSNSRRRLKTRHRRGRGRDDLSAYMIAVAADSSSSTAPPLPVPSSHLRRLQPNLNDQMGIERRSLPRDSREPDGPFGADRERTGQAPSCSTPSMATSSTSSRPAAASA
jgi:hypothetical protein